MCRNMETDERDLIVELFADLTGQLEDATELAVTVQSSKMPKPGIKQLAGELRQQLTSCDALLECIEQRLQS